MTVASGDAFEGDSVALLLERLHGAPGHALCMASVVIVGAEFLGRRVVRKDVIGGDKEVVRDRDDRLFVSAMPEDATVACGHGAVLRACRPESGLDQARPQPDAAFPGLARLVLASTPGQSPAQLARWRSLGNRLMSTPISAMRTSAVL
jgi:hypothetical protein